MGDDRCRQGALSAWELSAMSHRPPPLARPRAHACFRRVIDRCRDADGWGGRARPCTDRPVERLRGAGPVPRRHGGVVQPGLPQLWRHLIDLPCWRLLPYCKVLLLCPSLADRRFASARRSGDLPKMEEAVCVLGANFPAKE